ALIAAAGYSESARRIAAGVGRNVERNRYRGITGADGQGIRARAGQTSAGPTGASDGRECKSGSGKCEHHTDSARRRNLADVADRHVVSRANLALSESAAMVARDGQIRGCPSQKYAERRGGRATGADREVRFAVTIKLSNCQEPRKCAAQEIGDCGA